MNASVTDGPARSAMAAAVRTKSPAPMMAPIPSATKDMEPSVRLRGALPLSAMRPSIDLVRNNEPAIIFLSVSLVLILQPATRRPIRQKPAIGAHAWRHALLRDQTRYTGIPSNTIIR